MESTIPAGDIGFIESQLFTRQSYVVWKIEVVENKEIHLWWVENGVSKKEPLYVNFKLFKLLLCENGPKVFHYFKQEDSKKTYFETLKETNSSFYTRYSKYKYWSFDNQDCEIISFPKSLCVTYSFLNSKATIGWVDFYARLLRNDLSSRGCNIQLSLEYNTELIDLSNSVTLSNDCYEDLSDDLNPPYVTRSYQVVYIREHKRDVKTISGYDLVLKVWARLDEYEINFGINKDWICSGFTLPWYYYKSLKPGETKQLDILCLRI